VFEDDYVEENPGENDEGVCKECERYQQEIYRLNRLLRTELSSADYEATRQRLEELVQLQLRHQRKHI
jgi:hypothetical protein